jgi:hypothetical protein
MPTEALFDKYRQGGFLLLALKNLAGSIFVKMILSLFIVLVLPINRTL